MLKIRHLHQDLIPLVDESRNIQESLNLGELGKGIVDYMLSLELRTILIETICHKDRHIVHPGISWSRAKEYPMVSPSDLEERFDPRA